MDEMPTPTGHLSVATAKKALKITELCDSIELNFGEAFTNPSNGDFIFFILGSEERLCAIGCSPHGYTIELESDEGVEYYLVKNMKAWLKKLKKWNMTGYDSDDIEDKLK